MIILIKILLAFNFTILLLLIFLYLKYGISKIRKFNKKSFIFFAEPVTTIIPIRNGNKIVIENITGLLKNQPNKFSKVIAAVEDENERCFSDLKKLENYYDNFKVIISGNPGKNMGKAHNMLAGYNNSTTEIIIFMDADVKASKENYYDIYEKIKIKKNGGGFAPALYLKAETFGGKLIEIITNYYFTQSLASFGKIIPFRFCAGAFMMFKRSAIEKSGGLSRILNNISDDASLGKLLTGNGYQIAFSDYPVYMKLEKLSFIKSIRHIKKWLVIIRKFLGVNYFYALPSFYLGNIPFLCIICWLTFGIKIITVLLVILAMLFRLLSAIHLDHIIKRRKNIYHYLLIILLGLIQPVVWALCYLVSDLIWSGRKYNIGKGGIINSVKEL